MSAYVPTELYGGAITVELPSNYIDVSAIREVPDTQEVFLDKDGLTSVIFDLMERLDESQAHNDEEALKYHFQDIAGDSGDSTRLWETNASSLAHLPGTPAYTLLATQHSAPGPESRGPQPDFTAILLVLVRLHEQKTDILITVNIPHVPGEYPQEEVGFAAARQGPLVTQAAQIKQRILYTFAIKDFSLFVTEK